MIIAGIALVGCKDNFNELTDTDHRYIRFEFDSSDYFSNLLLEDGKGGFVMGMPFELSSTELLRISAYCYDTADNTLVAQKEIISSDGKNLTLEFQHLLKNKQYRFVFFADIVERDPYLEYMELWYQLQVKNYDTFCLLRNSISSRTQRNVLLYNEVILSPNNKVEKIDMSMMTYNGYIHLSNAYDFTDLSVCINLVSQIYTHIYNRLYDYGVYEFNRNNFDFARPIPITCVNNKEDLRLEISYQESTGDKRIKEFLVPMTDKPFILQVDCKNLTYILCDDF